MPSRLSIQSPDPRDELINFWVALARLVLEEIRQLRHLASFQQEPGQICDRADRVRMLGTKGRTAFCELFTEELLGLVKLPCLFQVLGQAVYSGQGFWMQLTQMDTTAFQDIPEEGFRLLQPSLGPQQSGQVADGYQRVGVMLPQHGAVAFQCLTKQGLCLLIAPLSLEQPCKGVDVDQRIRVMLP